MPPLFCFNLLNIRIDQPNTLLVHFGIVRNFVPVIFHIPEQDAVALQPLDIEVEVAHIEPDATLVGLSIKGKQTEFLVTGVDPCDLRQEVEALQRLLHHRPGFRGEGV